jgi:hypothetical protein
MTIFAGSLASALDDLLDICILAMAMVRCCLRFAGLLVLLVVFAFLLRVGFVASFNY